MGLFGNKVSKMQTPEQQYFASGASGRQARAAGQQMSARNERYSQQRAQEEREAAERRRQARVKRVGTIRRVGRNKYETEGWQIDGVNDHGTTYHEGGLGGFSVRELCRMSHGPNCRNCT